MAQRRRFPLGEPQVESTVLPAGFVLRDGTVIEKETKITYTRDSVTTSRIIQTPVHLAWKYVP